MNKFLKGLFHRHKWVLFTLSYCGTEIYHCKGMT